MSERSGCRGACLSVEGAQSQELLQCARQGCGWRPVQKVEAQDVVHAHGLHARTSIGSAACNCLWPDSCLP